MRRAAFFGVCHSCVSAIASGSAIGFLRKIILLLFALEFIQNKPTPPYTYGLGKGAPPVFLYLGEFSAVYWRHSEHGSRAQPVPLLRDPQDTSRTGHSLTNHSLVIKPYTPSVNIA